MSDSRSAGWPERQEYGDQAFSRDQLTADPLTLFGEWFKKAVDSDLQEANAVCLCTHDPAEGPDGRIVLLKGFDAAGFQFFTNYEGAKAAQLARDPRACLVFWWQPLRRQIRIRGSVERLSEADSDAYFASRPRESQLGAWASAQSRPISSRTDLDERLKGVEDRFEGSADHAAVPRPPHWGGYRLIASRYEFWQGRDSRLHDRFLYQLDERSNWTAQRLMP